MIQSFERDAKPEEIAEVFDRDGVVIVRELADHKLLDQLESEVRPLLDRQDVGGGGEFYGGSSKLLSAVIGHSFALGDMITDPLLMGVADQVIGPYCDNYQIGVSALLEVYKGGSLMTMHRDGDVYSPYLPPNKNHPVQIQYMWAVTDFTANNGATRYVPGSHKWETRRQWKESEVDVAVMPRGSVAMWHGGMLHGLGINETDTPRIGVTAGYTVGWLRQEQNQYLSIPPERVAQMPEKIRNLLGWQPHSAVLGWIVGNDPDQFAKDQRAANREWS